MTDEELAAAVRAVVLRHSRSLIDRDGDPTPEMVAELAGVARGFADARPPAARRTVTRRRDEQEQLPA